MCWGWCVYSTVCITHVLCTTICVWQQHNDAANHMRCVSSHMDVCIFVYVINHIHGGSQTTTHINTQHINISHGTDTTHHTVKQHLAQLGSPQHQSNQSHICISMQHHMQLYQFISITSTEHLNAFVDRVFTTVAMNAYCKTIVYNTCSILCYW